MSEFSLQDRLELAPPAKLSADGVLMVSLGALLAGTMLAGMSWSAGGSAILNTLAFALFTASSVLLLARETAFFTTNFNLGRMVFSAGVLLFFCQDYFSTYLRPDNERIEVKLGVIAMAAFYHGLFIFFATWAVHQRGMKWFTWILESLKEPRTPAAYLPLIIVSSIVGILPLLLFARGNFFEAVRLQILAGRGGAGVDWTVEGRGNLSSQWGSYIFFLFDVGAASGIFAAYYFLFLTQAWGKKLLCFCIWAYWMAVSFGSGTRGAVIMQLLPTVLFVFLRYQMQASQLFRRFSLKSYAYALVLLVFGFVLVQTQITFRNEGFQDMSLSEVDLSAPTGNHMFTESLPGFEHVPSDQPFFYDSVPGETLLAPIVVEAYFWSIHPIPRVIWSSKTIDPAWAWYNQLHSGNEGYEGTTISNGLVGYWYMRYGLAGVIEGGVIFGLILASIDTALKRSTDRPMTVFFCCGMAMVMFREFRSFTPGDFWALIVGVAGLWAILRVLDRLVSSDY